jgi:uncharacterized membrane protein
VTKLFTAHSLLTLRSLGVGLQSIFYIFAGINHFLNPNFYLSIIPAWLPFPVFLNGVAGVSEALAGVLFLIPKTRLVGAWFLISILLAVMPVNVNMAINGAPADFPLPTTAWTLWLRLPLQFLLIWLVYVFRNSAIKNIQSTDKI